MCLQTHAIFQYLAPAFLMFLSPNCNSMQGKRWSTHTHCANLRVFDRLLCLKPFNLPILETAKQPTNSPPLTQNACLLCTLHTHAHTENRPASSTLQSTICHVHPTCYHTVHSIFFGSTPNISNSYIHSTSQTGFCLPQLYCYSTQHVSFRATPGSPTSRSIAYPPRLSDKLCTCQQKAAETETVLRVPKPEFSNFHNHHLFVRSNPIVATYVCMYSMLLPVGLVCIHSSCPLPIVRRQKPTGIDIHGGMDDRHIAINAHS